MTFFDAVWYLSWISSHCLQQSDTCDGSALMVFLEGLWHFWLISSHCFLRSDAWEGFASIDFDKQSDTFDQKSQYCTPFPFLARMGIEVSYIIFVEGVSVQIPFISFLLYEPYSRKFVAYGETIQESLGLWSLWWFGFGEQRFRNLTWSSVFVLAQYKKFATGGSAFWLRKSALWWRYFFSCRCREKTQLWIQMPNGGWHDCRSSNSTTVPGNLQCEDNLHILFDSFLLGAQAALQCEVSHPAFLCKPLDIFSLLPPDRNTALSAWSLRITL